MELSKEDKRKWIDPIVIDTEEDAEKFVSALERAAAAQHKEIDVNYREITDATEIKEIFNSIIDNNICYETSCLHNTGCDVFEFNGEEPRCEECKQDCPYKIESVDAF